MIARLKTSPGVRCLPVPRELRGLHGLENGPIVTDGRHRVASVAPASWGLGSAASVARLAGDGQGAGVGVLAAFLSASRAQKYALASNSLG